MAMSGRLALLTWLCAGFSPRGHANAAEDPNVRADRVRQEAVAPTGQAEQGASAAKAPPLDRSARARLQEIVRQLPSILTAARPVLDDQLALRPGAAVADAEPLAQHDRAASLVAEEGAGTSEACAHRFALIRRGEKLCGISLGEDDRIHVAGRAIGEPIVGWGRPNRLFVSPASPGGRYHIIDACGDMCGRAFVLDLQDNSLRDTFAGRYGPEKDWILWSPDAA